MERNQSLKDLIQKMQIKEPIDIYAAYLTFRSVKKETKNGIFYYVPDHDVLDIVAVDGTKELLRDIVNHAKKHKYKAIRFTTYRKGIERLYKKYCNEARLNIRCIGKIFEITEL